LPLDTPDLWRYIFRKAGAHLFTENQAIIYSGQGTITVHTKEGGPVVLQLRNGKSVNYVMPPNSTWLIDDETGDQLFK